MAVWRWYNSIELEKITKKVVMDRWVSPRWLMWSLNRTDLHHRAQTGREPIYQRILHSDWYSTDLHYTSALVKHKFTSSHNTEGEQILLMIDWWSIKSDTENFDNHGCTVYSGKCFVLQLMDTMMTLRVTPLLNDQCFHLLGSEGHSLVHLFPLEDWSYLS